MTAIGGAAPTTAAATDVAANSAHTAQITKFFEHMATAESAYAAFEPVTVHNQAAMQTALDAAYVIFAKLAKESKDGLPPEEISRAHFARLFFLKARAHFDGEPHVAGLFIKIALILQLPQDHCFSLIKGEIAMEVTASNDLAELQRILEKRQSGGTLPNLDEWIQSTATSKIEYVGADGKVKNAEKLPLDLGIYFRWLGQCYQATEHDSSTAKQRLGLYKAIYGHAETLLKSVAEKSRLSFFKDAEFELADLHFALAPFIYSIEHPDDSKGLSAVILKTTEYLKHEQDSQRSLTLKAKVTNALEKIQRVEKDPTFERNGNTLAIACLIMSVVSAIITIIGIATSAPLLIGGGVLSVVSGGLMLLRWHYRAPQGLHHKAHYDFAVAYPAAIGVAAVAVTLFSTIPAVIFGALSGIVAGVVIYKSETAPQPIRATV